MLAGAEDGLAGEAVRALQMGTSEDLLLLDGFWLGLLQLKFGLLFLVKVESRRLDHLVGARAAALTL